MSLPVKPAFSQYSSHIIHFCNAWEISFCQRRSDDEAVTETDMMLERKRNILKYGERGQCRRLALPVDSAVRGWKEALEPLGRNSVSLKLREYFLTSLNIICRRNLSRKMKRKWSREEINEGVWQYRRSWRNRREMKEKKSEEAHPTEEKTGGNLMKRILEGYVTERKTLCGRAGQKWREELSAWKPPRQKRGTESQEKM